MARTVITPNALASNVFENLVQTSALNITDGAEILWGANDERLLILASNNAQVERSDTFAGDGTEVDFTLATDSCTEIISILVNDVALSTDNITDTFDGDGASKSFQLGNMPITSITSVTVGETPVDGGDISFDANTGILTLATAPAQGTENVSVVYVAAAASTNKATGVVTFASAPANEAVIVITYIDDTAKTLTIAKGDSAQAAIADLVVTVPYGQNWTGWLESGKYLQCYNTAADTAKKGKVIMTGDVNIKLACLKI